MNTGLTSTLTGGGPDADSEPDRSISMFGSPLKNNVTSKLTGGGPDAESAPAYSIPMFGGGGARVVNPRRPRITTNAVATYGQHGSDLLDVPTPVLGGRPDYLDEEHQRMLANMGIVPRGPSPEFAAEQSGRIARGDTTALDPTSLPQFDPTGGAHDRTVDLLDASRPVLGRGRVAGAVGSVAGTSAEPTVVQEAKAFHDLVGDPLMGNGLGVDEAKRLSGLAPAPTTAPTPDQSSPGPVSSAMLGTVARPRLGAGEVNPATGLTADQAAANDRNFRPNPKSIQFTEQHARSAFGALAAQNPNAPLMQFEPQFMQMMNARGIDGQAMLDKWKQDGTYGKFSFDTGDTQPAVARPTMSRAQGQKILGTGQVETGAAGGKPLLVTQPNGQTVMVDANGQRVGPVVTHDSPLPARPVLGGQPGYTPAPTIDPNSTAADPVTPGAQAYMRSQTAASPAQQIPQIPTPRMGATISPSALSSVPVPTLGAPEYLPTGATGVGGLSFANNAAPTSPGLTAPNAPPSVSTYGRPVQAATATTGPAPAAGRPLVTGPGVQQIAPGQVSTYGAPVQPAPAGQPSVVRSGTLPDGSRVHQLVDGSIVDAQGNRVQ